MSALLPLPAAGQDELRRIEQAYADADPLAALAARSTTPARRWPTPCSRSTGMMRRACAWSGCTVRIRPPTRRAAGTRPARRGAGMSCLNTRCSWAKARTRSGLLRRPCRHPGAGTALGDQRAGGAGRRLPGHAELPDAAPGGVGIKPAHGPTAGPGRPARAAGALRRGMNGAATRGPSAPPGPCGSAPRSCRSRPRRRR